MAIGGIALIPISTLASLLRPGCFVHFSVQSVVQWIINTLIFPAVAPSPSGPAHCSCCWDVVSLFGLEVNTGMSRWAQVHHTHNERRSCSHRSDEPQTVMIPVQTDKQVQPAETRLNLQLQATNQRSATTDWTDASHWASRTPACASFRLLLNYMFLQRIVSRAAVM